MTLFGRPVSSAFNSNAAIAALQGFGIGAITGFVEARAHKSDHPWREAITTGAAWGATDLAVEVGINLVAPNIRGEGVLRSAAVSAVLGGATGAVEGFIAGKVQGDENPWKRAAASGAAWAALDAGWNLAETPVRQFINNHKFPR